MSSKQEQTVVLPSVSPSIVVRRAHTGPKKLSLSTFAIHKNRNPLIRSPIMSSSARGFSPLPVIIASPVCTPPSAYFNKRPTVYGTEDLVNTGQNPTWISIPPTPPPRLSRPLVISLPQNRPSSVHITPSASFPAFSPAHGTPLLIKRPVSLPELTKCKPSLTLETPSYFSSLNSSTTAVQSQPSSGRRSLFHIPTHSGSDDDDIIVDSPTVSDEESVTHLSAKWAHDKGKDNIRKYYAMMELLTTEVGYLLDLRILVTIYLRNLPTLLCSRSSSSAPSSFSRPPSAFNLSSLHLQLTPAVAVEPQPLKESKSSYRYVFSDVDIETLTRNAEEVLELHQHFVQELSAVVKPLGFSMTVPDNIDEVSLQKEIDVLDKAVGAVSTKFATEASRFHAYQTFCAGHPQALTLIRKAQQQHSIAWEGFERRCADMVSDLLNNVSEESAQAPPEVRQRTHSLPSIDGPALGARQRTTTGPAPVTADIHTNARKAAKRLTCMDYMIKPVQRICKYPLLLDQLKTSKSLSNDSATFLTTRSPLLRSDVQVVVESATQAMKHVAVSVDEARHRQDVEIQTSLIIQRILLASPAPNVPHVPSMHPPFHVLSPAFLSSLGVCLLAGSLDVMHHHSNTPINSANIKAKYFGAFLFLGGYLLLVKVSKNKMYEPKHWFSLVNFEVVDVQGEDAMLPCSFRLTDKVHRFELAAACQREKEVWIISIRDSLTQVPPWTNEPTSSLLLDSKGELVPCALEEDPFVSLGQLPTIQSITELTAPDVVSPSRPRSSAGKLAKQDTLPKPDMINSRRSSSSASVKGMFNPSESETILIRRSSPNARAQVDNGLSDVISQTCHTARSHANSREEELFKAPSVTRSGMLRSNSGISMSMAKSRLSRHESVRVPRRKSLLETANFPTRRTSMISTSPNSRRNKKALSIVSATTSDGHNLHLPSSDIGSSESPAAFSQCSSVGSSEPVSTPSQTSLSNDHIKINVHNTHQAVDAIRRLPIDRDSPQHKVRNRRSVIENVKCIFLSRPTSPQPKTTSPPAHETEMKSYTKTPTASMLKRWAQDTLHRRAKSAPEETPNVAHSAPHSSPRLPGLDFGPPDLDYSSSTSSRMTTSRSFFHFAHNRT